MPIPLHLLPSKPVDAPSLDRSAAKALKVLDPDLVIFFSRFHVQPDCRIAKDDLGKPLGEWPRWTVALWNEREDRFYRILTLQTSEMEYLPFDHRTVKALRSDVVRVKGLKAAINYRAEQREIAKEQGKKQLASDRRDWADENEQKVREVMDNPHHRYGTHRSPKIFGYKGNTKQDTSGKLIKKTASELGYRNEALERRK